VVEGFEGLKANQAHSYVHTEINKRDVKLVSLDSYFSNNDVDFIKIDIEGYEWFALQGAANLIRRCKPSLMVEIQSHHVEIFEWFRQNDYVCFSPARQKISQLDDFEGNIFFLHEKKHAELIQEIAATCTEGRQ
jgi:hypothetical protein